MRVPLFLADEQVAFETILHPPAFTATRRARFLGVSGKDLAKCVLLRGPRGHVLAILPATGRVDMTAVNDAVGGPVQVACREEIPQVFGDCEWGGLVPFGRLYGLPTLLDDSFDPERALVFEAHSHALAIRLRCRDFERLEKPRRLRLASQPSGRFLPQLRQPQ